MATGKQRAHSPVARGLSLCVILGLSLGENPQTDMYPPLASNRDQRFGLIEAHAAQEAANELGVGWSRIKFHWAEIQPYNPLDGLADYNLHETLVDSELALGRETVGLLIGIPAWARDERGLPRGLDLPYDDPQNVWAQFVAATVARFRGRITHWIIWNEPDVWDASHPGFTWPGTEAEFAQLMRVSYLATHAVNPDAVVHLAAMSYWWDTHFGRELFFARLLEVLKTDPNASATHYYYDVLTLHLYFNSADVYEIISLYREVQRSFGLEKPVWLVETNAAPSSDESRLVANPTFEVSLHEQAAYIPQALSLGLAAGADRIGIYKLLDTPGDLAANPEPFGLVRSDGSRRPAFHTYRTAIEHLSGGQDAYWLDRGVISQVIVSKPDELVRIIWSRVESAYEVEIPAVASRALLVDMWGNRRAIVADAKGNYNVLVYGSECQETVEEFCMIGGPPLYILERNGVEVSDTSQLSISSFERADALVIASFEDGNVQAMIGLWRGLAILLVGLLVAVLVAVRRKPEAS